MLGVVRSSLRLYLFADYVQGKAPFVRAPAMFEKINALPFSEREFALDHGHDQLHLRERGTNVRGHIVSTFVVVVVASRILRRDPFEGSVGFEPKTLLGQGGALAGPVTAYIYDWNIIPIGQALWLQELESYGPYPALQSPASYSLAQVLTQVRDQMARTRARGD